MRKRWVRVKQVIVIVVQNFFPRPNTHTHSVVAVRDVNKNHELEVSLIYAFSAY